MVFTHRLFGLGTIFLSIVVIAVGFGVFTTTIGAHGTHEEGKLTDDGGYGANYDQMAVVTNGVVYFVRSNYPHQVVKWNGGTSLSVLWTAELGEQVQGFDEANGNITWFTKSVTGTHSGQGRVYFSSGSGYSLVKDWGQAVNGTATDGSKVAYAATTGGIGTDFEIFEWPGGANRSTDGGNNDVYPDMDASAPGKIVWWSGAGNNQAMLWNGSGKVHMAFPTFPAPSGPVHLRVKPVINGNRAMFVGYWIPNTQYAYATKTEIFSYPVSVGSTTQVTNTGTNIASTAKMLITSTGLAYSTNLGNRWLPHGSTTPSNIYYGKLQDAEGSTVVVGQDATDFSNGSIYRIYAPTNTTTRIDSQLGKAPNMSGDTVVWHRNGDIWIYTDVASIPFPLNEAPFASAGGPYNAYENGSVNLNAGGSTDANQSTSTLSFSWDTDGNGIYGDASGMSQTITGAQVGTSSKTVSVLVTDNGGLTSTASASLTVFAPPEDGGAPIQNALGGTVVDDAGSGASLFVPAGALSPSNSLGIDIEIVPLTLPSWTPVMPSSTWRISDPFGFVPSTGTFSFALPSVLRMPTIYPSSSYSGPAQPTLHRRPSGTTGSFLPDLSGISIPNWSGSFASMSLSGLASEYVWIIDNTAPTAIAGGPYIVDAGNSVGLDGSASFDPDTSFGDSIVSYEWDMDNDGFYDDAVGATPSFGPLSGSGTSPIALLVTDSLGATHVGSTTLTVVNAAPVAVDDPSFSTPEDTSLVIAAPGVLDNDTDFEGDTPFTATLVSGPLASTGLLTFNSDGSFTFDPALNFNGSVTFTYTTTDSASSVSAPGTVTIDVAPVNDPPTTVGQTLTMFEDGTFTVILPPLGTDVDGDILTAKITALPASGTLHQIELLGPGAPLLSAPVAVNDFLGLGRIAYRPAPNEFGAPYSSFEYVLNDGTVDSAPATIAFGVLPVNDAPVANSDGATTDEDAAVSFTLTGSDVEDDDLTLSFAVFSLPANGSLTLAANGDAVFTPSADWNGSSSFQFTVEDSNGEISPPSTVNLTVLPVDDPPVPGTNDLVTDEDVVLTVALAASDIDTASLTFVVTTPPAHGVLVIAGGGTGSYLPDSNYHGPDSFEFTVSDTTTVVPGTANVTVNPVNDVPVANSDSATTDEDAAVSFTLTGSDVEDDDLTLSFAVFSLPANGSLTLAANGDAVFTPSADWNGSSSFQFTVEDSNGEISPPSTVILTVLPVDDPPVPGTNDLVTDEDVVLTVALAASDIDTASLTFVVTTPPAHGVLVIAGAGTGTYLPDSNYHGSDSFEFTVADTTTVVPGTANVTVISVNDAPEVSVPVVPPVEATGPLGAIVDFVATAIDDNDGALEPVCTPSSGTELLLGIHTIICVATDVDGLTGTASFDVVVQDTTPPVLTVPADMTELASSSDGFVVLFAVTAFDVAGPTAAPVCIPASGTLFPIATTAVSCSVEDTRGNTGTASFTITILGGRSLIQAAVDGIAEFTDENKRFRNALKDLEKALDDELWTDEVHPDAKHGEQVFSRIRSAIQDLDKMLSNDEYDDDKKGKHDDELTDEQVAAIELAIDNLVTAVRILASTAIADAEAGTTLDPEKQSKVDKELAKARDYFADADAESKLDKSIDKFKKAWQHALKAIKE